MRSPSNDRLTGVKASAAWRSTSTNSPSAPCSRRRMPRRPSSSPAAATATRRRPRPSANQARSPSTPRLIRVDGSKVSRVMAWVLSMRRRCTISRPCRSREVTSTMSSRSGRISIACAFTQRSSVSKAGPPSSPSRKRNTRRWAMPVPGARAATTSTSLPAQPIASMGQHSRISGVACPPGSDTSSRWSPCASCSTFTSRSPRGLRSARLMRSRRQSSRTGNGSAPGEGGRRTSLSAVCGLPANACCAR